MDLRIAISNDPSTGLQMDQTGFTYFDPGEHLVRRGEDINTGTRFDVTVGQHLQVARINRDPVGLNVSSLRDTDCSTSVQGCASVHLYHAHFNIFAGVQLRITPFDPSGFDAAQGVQEHTMGTLSVADPHRPQHRCHEGSRARVQTLCGERSSFHQQINMAAGLQAANVQPALGTGQPDTAARFRIERSFRTNVELERPTLAGITDPGDIALC